MCIHAMSPEGRSAKARFLRDAWRYARALGQALACYGGFIEWKLVRNEGNENEAGNVMAYYYHSRLDYWLAVYIEADKQKTALPRPDGVIIIACKRSIKLLPRRGDAQLHYLNPALNSDHLAHVLLLLMGKKTWTDLQSYANEIYKSTRPLMIYPRAPDQAWEEKRMLIRVYLLGDYRWCSLLKPGISRAEVCCVDNHLAVALTYWGKRVTVPLQRVHPDDIANICHVNEVVLTTKDHFSPDSPVRASSHNVPSDTKQR
jgi:hypothetical protein